MTSTAIVAAAKPGVHPVPIPMGGMDGVCEAAQGFSFLQEIAGIKAGSIFKLSFVVANLMTDANGDAYMILVDTTAPARGITLWWFDVKAPPATTFNMVANRGSSRLSSNVDTQLAKWLASDKQFEASVDASRDRVFEVDHFVHCMADAGTGEPRVKARFKDWSAAHDCWYALTELEGRTKAKAVEYLRKQRFPFPVVATKPESKVPRRAYTTAEDALLLKHGPRVLSWGCERVGWQG